ncbi:MAG TPA: glycosyltransferase family 4 protein, partial [Terriglobales bacterium]|nr:glycosyltransferase family 4 protein [Terriglobales bacterium]
KALHRRIMLSQIRILAGEERRSAMAFDQILVNSLFSRESIWRAYGIDSKVCYLGVDTDRFTDRKRTRERIAVSIGAMVERKNAAFILQALAKVPAPLRPKLIWVADTIDPEYLKRMEPMAEAFQVAFQVRHQVDDNELVEILGRARFLLYAPRLEPFGYAPLEANACGAPVVAVAEGGVRETVRDGVNGLLVEHDAEAMAAAIERLMADDDLACRLGQEGSHWVRQQWALPASIDRLESRLKSALAKGRNSRVGQRWTA